MEPISFDTKNQSHLINGTSFILYMKPVIFDTWNQSNLIHGTSHI